MNLLKILYNNKPYLVLNLAMGGNKLYALNLNSENKVSDIAINTLRSRIESYKLMEPKKVISDLKTFLPYNSIYRTFSLDKI